MIIIKDKSYSFDDEVSIGFAYSNFEKKIKIDFDAFYENEKHINRKCSLIIEKWTDAKSRMHKTKKFDDLERHLGVFSIILDIENKDNQLSFTANTIDDRYVELHFKDPNIYIEFIKK